MGPGFGLHEGGISSVRQVFESLGKLSVRHHLLYDNDFIMKGIWLHARCAK